ncbi:MAG: transposase [Deltaproteobacteria bacterium]|nr:transposase [Deltaproteobacteria bacterium]
MRVEFQGALVTSDGGLLLVHELDERLGFGELIERHLSEGRGKNTQLPLTDLVRQSIYSRLTGYEDVNDAERLSQDPAFRLIGSQKVWEQRPGFRRRYVYFCRAAAAYPELASEFCRRCIKVEIASVAN